MSVAVVIPTRDRPAALAACLAAVAAQQPAPDEIVVVDDASLDAAAVRAVVAGCPVARLVVGPGEGPAVARNLGVQATSSTVVLFVDDDCRPGPGWSAALVDALDDGPVAAGPTVVAAGLGPSCAAAQVVTNHLVRESRTADGRHVRFAPTCNLAVRSSLLRRLPFDEGYPLAAGEDRDWCDRVAAAGGRIAWVPTAEVVHHPALQLRSFWRQQVRYGRGAARFRADGALRRARPGIGFYARLVGRGFRCGPRVGGLVLLAQLATLVGVRRERRVLSARA